MFAPAQLDQVKRLVGLGIEKVVLNSAAAENPRLVEQAVSVAGSSSVVVSIDVRRSLFGKYAVAVRGGRVSTGRDPVECARAMEQLGAGEILLQSIDREGTQSGYDLELIGRVASAVSIPLVASGGAGSMQDFREAVRAGASAAAAGSYFVFHGKHRAVLITYPEYDELRALFRS